MKRFAMLLLLILMLAVGAALGQAAPSVRGGHDHFEAGIFVDYLALERTRPHTNLVGFGGRAAFNLTPHWQIEGEMAYDFKRNFTSTFSDGIQTQLVNTRLRTLHGLFGPKVETSAGPLRAFATFKTGFINFGVSDQNALPGFKGALGSVTSGNTNFALYPGVGAEGFIGPIGLRFDVGDEMYFDNGARHNLRVTFGPHLRF